jgi:hypothetical protein
VARAERAPIRDLTGRRPFWRSSFVGAPTPVSAAGVDVALADVDAGASTPFVTLTDTALRTPIKAQDPTTKAAT